MLTNKKLATRTQRFAGRVQGETLTVPILGTMMPNMGMNSKKPTHKKGNAKGRPVRSSLADALFSTTQRRVLGLLFGQPNRSFFANEIIDRVGAGSGAVQRELKKLADSGLVSVTWVGNQKHFQKTRSMTSSRGRRQS